MIEFYRNNFKKDNQINLDDYQPCPDLLYKSIFDLFPDKDTKSFSLWEDQNQKTMSWGDWGNVDMCPDRTYTYAFQHKCEGVTDNDDGFDNTASNGVKLLCMAESDFDNDDTGSVTSAIGHFGDWNDVLSCPLDSKLQMGVITGISIYYQTNYQDSGDHDQVSVTGMSFTCRGHGWQFLPAEGSFKGLVDTKCAWWVPPRPYMGCSWTKQLECPPGYAVCGIQTRVEKPQGKGDDTALNDVKLRCCWNPDLMPPFGFTKNNPAPSSSRVVQKEDL